MQHMQPTVSCYMWGRCKSANVITVYCFKKLPLLVINKNIIIYYLFYVECLCLAIHRKKYNNNFIGRSSNFIDTERDFF